MTGHGHLSPAYMAQRVYEDYVRDNPREEGYMTFSQLCDGYFLNGYVVSTPNYFILARPVNKEADPLDIINPVIPFPREEWNAWYIAAMAGDPSLCWTFYPFELDYVGYQRVTDEIESRWFKTSQIRRITKIVKIMNTPKPPDPIPPVTTDPADADKAAKMAQRNRAKGKRGAQSTILSGQGAGSANQGYPQGTGKTILS